MSFNLAPYNRKAVLEAYITATAETATNCTSSMIRTMPYATTSTNTEAELITLMVREIPLIPYPTDTSTACTTLLIRQIPFTFSTDVCTELSSGVNLRYTFSADIHVSTEVITRLIREMPYTVATDTSTVLVASFIREMPYALAADTSTELITKLIRDMPYQARVDTATQVEVAITYYHVDELRFLGDFKAGDILVIDSKKMTATLNGESVLHLLQGDLFKLAFGTNKMTYTDASRARNIRTRITHRNKYLY
jgi:hypothetical protein